MPNHNIRPGSIVTTPDCARAMVVEVDELGVTVETNHSPGRDTFAFCEVKLYRDQTPIPRLARFWAPYLIWTCADGTEVLANRHYKALLIRRPGQQATIATGTERVPYIACRWLYGTPPWASVKVARRLDALLAEWGFPAWRGEGLATTHSEESDEGLKVPDWAEPLWLALMDNEKQVKRPRRTRIYFEE